MEPNTEDVLRKALTRAMQKFQDRTFLDEANHRYHCGGSEAGRLMEYLVPELEAAGIVLALLEGAA